MKLIIFCFACIALVLGKQRRDQPCQRNDPYVEQCLLNKFKRIKPRVQEPIAVDHIYADTSMHGVKMKAILSNVVAYQESPLQITHLKVNLHNIYQYTGEIRVVFPTLYITADYDFEGTKWFNFPFKTNGNFIGKFDNVAVVIKCTAAPSIYNAGYLEMGFVSTQVSIGTGQIQLNQADSSWTGRQIAWYARSNPTGSLQKLTPAIEDHAARLFKDLSNNILSRVPSKNFLV